MKKYLLKSITLVLTLVRILLKNSSPWIVFIKSGGADDWYQAQSALSILQGKWFGDYTWTTLSKGASFPLFLAFCRRINLPYGFGIGLLLVITAIIASVSLSPILKKEWQKSLLYIGLLYCPIFFAPSSLQLYRNTLVPIISLGVVSCAVGAYLRYSNNLQLLIWMIGEGLYLAFFWYLREDSVWILPFCMAAGIIIILKILNNDEIRWRNRALCFLIVLIPGIFVLSYKTGIERINFQYYGLKTTNDRSKTACSDVMKLLYRIEDQENNNPDVWVSKKSIEKAINVSPTLSSISERLMKMRNDWAGGADHEIKGDMFEWVLRNTVDSMGLYTTADSTDAFYRKIYNELNEGFQDGRLKKEKAIFLSSQTGGFHFNDFMETFTIAAKATGGVLYFNQCDINIDETNREIDGEEYQIRQAEYLLGSVLHRSEEQMANANKNTELYEINELIKENRIKNVKIANIITGIYRVSAYIIWSCIIGGSIFLCYRRNEHYCLFLRENIIWIIGVFLIAFFNIYMVFLFSRWITRDPMSNVVEYYAPSVFGLFEYIKLGMISIFIQDVYSEIQISNSQ